MVTPSRVQELDALGGSAPGRCRQYTRQQAAGLNPGRSGLRGIQSVRDSSSRSAEGSQPRVEVPAAWYAERRSVIRPGPAMKHRDLMSPETEPTDEELALVMRAARDAAVQRRAKADAWIAARLTEASRLAQGQAQAPASGRRGRSA